MAVEDDILGLTGAFYDAALDPDLWPDTLHSYSRFFGGVGGVMHSLTLDRSLLHVSADLLEATAEYQSEWWSHDPLVEVARRKKYKDGVFRDVERLDEEVIAKGAFYQDFLRRHGIGGVAGLLASPIRDITISFSIQTPLGHVFKPGHMKLLEALCGHLTRAAAIGARIGSFEALRDTLFAGFDRFGCGVALVRTDGTVLAANRELQNLSRRGLSIVRGRLVPESAGQQHALDRLIAAAASPTAADDGAAITLRRSASERDLVIRAMPVAAQTLERKLPGVRPEHCVLLLAMDPDVHPKPDANDLLRAYGLTPTQAKVADLLAAGLAPQEIADRHGVSLHTIRTILKAVYERMGVNRQVDLARIVTRIRTLE
ncbi:helix-turn-helix transcriptional regulator [Chthonobacter albigriseus]|uniref:helix-turn-helix transcriptional regulator n=1 Tax=Chthonobacter albigriseus TaxID=1683161 RepID=UPI0015EFD991|nr:helix-turn-helix transcriptional regulator [Chthonobacter albigriseus]